MDALRILLQLVIKLFEIININEGYFCVFQYLFHYLNRKIKGNSVNVEIYNR